MDQIHLSAEALEVHTNAEKGLFCCSRNEIHLITCVMLALAGFYALKVPFLSPERNVVSSYGWVVFVTPSCTQASLLSWWWRAVFIRYVIDVRNMYEDQAMRVILWFDSDLTQLNGSRSLTFAFHAARMLIRFRWF